MYKTPQELFSSFKIPDLTEKGSEGAVPEETLSSENVRLKRNRRNLPADLASPAEVKKHRRIQPNVRMPASRKISSPEANKQSSIFQASPAIFALSGASRPHFPIPCTGGPVPHFDPMLYGATGMLLNMRAELQPSFRLASSCDRQKYPDQENGGLPSLEEPLTINAGNTLSQNVDAVQSQMAAAHIPLCLVQDANGKLHQLVYTVPARIYEHYIQAAKSVLYDNALVPSNLDKDASKAVDTSNLDSKPKTSRQRKRECLYLSPKYNKRLKESKSNDKDGCVSTILKGTSESADNARSGSTTVGVQTMKNLPKVQLPFETTTTMETTVDRKARIDSASTDMPTFRSLVSSDPSKDKGTIQTLTESNVPDCRSGSAFKESVINIDASACRENLTGDCSGKSNKKNEPLQAEHDRKSIEVDIVSRFSKKSCSDEVCAHTTHEREAASGEAVQNELHNCEDRPLDFDTDIEEIIKPHCSYSDEAVMQDALARLKSRVDDAESRPSPGARFHSGTNSEQVNSIYSHNYPDSPSYWTIKRPSGVSVIDDLVSAAISTFSSDVSICRAANDLDTIVSDLSCRNENATSCDLYSPAPMSANSCATFDSGISTSGSFESVDALDNFFEESTQDAILEADHMPSSDPCHNHSIEDMSFQSYFETDISGSENLEQWINAKYLDNLRDNFFGSDGTLVFPESGLIDNHSLIPDYPKTREPSSGCFGMNELDFLDDLIEGL